jgi:hypothetical protein
MKTLRYRCTVLPQAGAFAAAVMASPLPAAVLHHWSVSGWVLWSTPGPHGMLAKAAVLRGAQRLSVSRNPTCALQ